MRLALLILLLLGVAPLAARADDELAPEGDICLERGGEVSGDVSLRCDPPPAAPTQGPTFTRTPPPTNTPPAATSTATATFNTPTPTATFDFTPCGVQPQFAGACYNGNGVSPRDVITCFEPDFLWVEEHTGPGGNNNAQILWLRDFGTNASVFLGGQNSGFLTNRILDTIPIGFTVGSDSSVNASGRGFCFMAFANDDQNFTSGVYVGNGDTGDRTIALPFEPTLVMVVPLGGGGFKLSRRVMAGAGKPIWLINGVPDTQSGELAIGPGAAFTVNLTACGSAFCSINTNGTSYAYLAFHASPGWTAAGIETGSGEPALGVASGCDALAGLMVATGYVAGGGNPHENGNCRVWEVQNDITCPYHVFTSAPPTGGGLACTGIDSLVSNFGDFTITAQPSGFERGCLFNGVETEWFGVCTSATKHNVPVNNFPNQGQDITCRDDFDASPAADWTGDFVAVWDFEGETIGNTAVAGGSCGSDCDLTDHNTVDRTGISGEFISGAKAAVFTAGNSEYLSCDLTTCNELDLGGSGSSLTFGAWWQTLSDPTTRYTMSKGGSGAGTDAFYMRRERGGVPDRLGQVAIREAGGTLHSTNAVANVPIQQWMFTAARFDNAANVWTAAGARFDTGSFDIQISTAFTTDMLTGTTGEFDLGRLVTGATGYWDGFIDMAFVYGGVLSDADLCRIASCGITGALCTCYDDAPTVYKTKGYNGQLGTCTLPACNKAAPAP